MSDTGPPAILWQDDTAVVVSKPSGILVHNSAYSGPRELSLRQSLRAYLGEVVNPVHRLDRGASGVVLFARGGEGTPGAARAWQAAWASPDTEKCYLALVRGRLALPVEVDHPIREDRRGGTGIRERPARSLVTPVADSPVARCSLVRVRLFTGRKHQVRRHLKHLSHPIVGDTTWGKGDVNRWFREHHGLHRLALHAETVTVFHPTSGERLRWTAPLPEGLSRVLAELFPGLGDPAHHTA